MASSAGKQITTIYILPNIPISDNEIYSVSRTQQGNIFLEKLYTKDGGETSSTPLSKKQN